MGWVRILRIVGLKSPAFCCGYVKADKKIKNKKINNNNNNNNDNNNNNNKYATLGKYEGKYWIRKKISFVITLIQHSRGISIAERGIQEMK